MAAKDLSQERLQKLFSYDHDTGLFTRKLTTSSRAIAGMVAGSLKKDGRIRITVDSVEYMAHRLAWLYVYGNWPNGVIDHINGDPSDNRLCNLRDVTPEQNSQNKRKATSVSTTGMLGVENEKNRGLYRAVITISGKKKFIGRFKTAIEAHEAYKVAKREYHEACTI